MMTPCLQTSASKRMTYSAGASIFAIPPTGFTSAAFVAAASNKSSSAPGTCIPPCQNINSTKQRAFMEAVSVAAI